MSNDEWNAWTIRCSHCRESFTQGRDELLAGHTRLVLAATAKLDADSLRRITENFEVPCPACGESVPVEPLSMYRPRKREAMSKRFTALADLKMDPKRPWEFRLMSKEEIGAIDRTCLAAGDLYRSMKGARPLHLIKESTEETMRDVERDVLAMGPNANSVEPLRLLREMALIAPADVGEQEQLVDVSSQEVEAKRERVSALLRDSNQRQASSDSDSNQLPTDKSKCFVATAALGTPDHPLVEVLRDFRDRRLVGTRKGRALVRLYEQLAPSIANWIRSRPIACALVRGCVIRPAVLAVRLIERRSDRQL
jgi:hypothetical protein